MSDAVDQARALIQSRLTEIETEGKELERALAKLGTNSGATGRVQRRDPSPAKPKPKRRHKAARARRGQRREELLAALKASPGARPAKLAKSIGISQTQVHGLLAKARAEKLVVKRGKGYEVRK